MIAFMLNLHLRVAPSVIAFSLKENVRTCMQFNDKWQHCQMALIHFSSPRIDVITPDCSGNNFNMAYYTLIHSTSLERTFNLEAVF